MNINTNSDNYEEIAPPAPSGDRFVHETLIELRPALEKAKKRIQELPSDSMVRGVFFDEFSDEKKSIDEMQRVIAEELKLKLVVDTEIVSVSTGDAEVMATVYLLSSKGYLPFISRSGETKKVDSHLPFSHKHLQAAETLAVIKVLGAIGLLDKELVEFEESEIKTVQNDKPLVQKVTEPEVDNVELESVIPAKTKAGVDTKSKVESDSNTKKKIDAEAKNEAKAKAKEDADDKAKAKAKSEAEAKAKSEAEAKAKSEAEAKKKSEAKAKADNEAKADVNKKAKSVKTKETPKSKADAKEVEPEKTPIPDASEKRGRIGKTTKRRVARAGRRAALSAIINDSAPKAVQEERQVPKAHVEKKPTDDQPPVAKSKTVKAEAKVESVPTQKRTPTKRNKLKLKDATKLDAPVKEDPAAKIDVQSKIAGTSPVDSELSRQEMIDSVRSVAEENEIPVSIIISDALNRDATQFDDASDDEIGYIYKKYVLNMGEEL